MSGLVAGMSDDERMASMVAKFGPCICSTEGYGCSSLCLLCEALDPEWPCPNEPQETDRV